MDYRTRPLPRRFYARPTIDVARDLLGKVLVHGEHSGAITEVEAYLGLDDLAAHASRGITPRTRVIFGPPGHAYIYLIYGIHECLNVVAEPDGTPGCVLIRSVEGHGNGPGKLTRSMNITRAHYGADLTRGPLTIHEPRHPRPFDLEVTPRIGIRHCADWPLRFLAHWR
ncbi:MAG: DNA-3-methyladenine glycosylase [Bryobacteraceae bacterium]|nr:DNA-3-methyladenine glycosylase [Bryobacteraceae bacterium]